MLTPAEAHALDRTDIAVIPAQRDDNMPLRWQHIVGGIHVKPAIPCCIDTTGVSGDAETRVSPPGMTAYPSVVATT